MSHISETSTPLQIAITHVEDCRQLFEKAKGLDQVCLVRLPHCASASDFNRPLENIGNLLSCLPEQLDAQATLIILGEVIDLVQIQAQISSAVRYQHWIAIKKATAAVQDLCHLPNEHFGALVYTRYPQSLRHTKTRLEYTYCPVCNKTTKDYGGKKHTYHEAGTLLSDVWRDVQYDFTGNLDTLYQRFADLFGLNPYTQLDVFDLRDIKLKRCDTEIQVWNNKDGRLDSHIVDRILNGDCLNELRDIETNSIDFAFTDPPYNLGKKYAGYADALEIQDYFKWCDEWIAELARVLKPGRTLALLNIPLWAIRHFLYLQKILEFQNWIIWDALAFPVRLIMPAHYTILCFTKGTPRELPGLVGTSRHIGLSGAPKSFHALEPLADNFCLRNNCVETRRFDHINDRAALTDLWTDIHRLKHNSRRVDHPTQLPPHLMYRILTLFTKPGEIVLDCFNGSGTTTLAAQQLGRHFVGIEASKKYAELARERHIEVQNGIDPFRKAERVLTSKNSRVPRLAKQIYKVPKKILQIEVKHVANLIGHIPTRQEMIERGKYPIEYYDNYFVSWGEVTAAARTTGMKETRVERNTETSQEIRQLQLLEKKQSYQVNTKQSKKQRKNN